VHFADARTGWAVGVGGTILPPRDGGTRWQRQNSGTDKNLYSVHFADPHTGWAVGTRGIILATRDGGTRWESQNGGSDKVLLSVHFANAHTGWTVGDRGTILATIRAPAGRSGGQGGSWRRATVGPAGSRRTAGPTRIFWVCILPTRTPVGRSA
jgi:photosystem II stability/assembly factor-like uncharacterized protein